jgi:acetylornithine deacetylase/succinyl-diaminopimelate desuccinylase-like protein
MRFRVGQDPEVVRFDCPDPAGPIGSALDALDEFADALAAEKGTIGIRGVPDEECDAVTSRRNAAERAAIRAIRSAVAGPSTPGEPGGRYHGHRGIVGRDGQLYILAESNMYDDRRDSFIVAVPFSAIHGLGGDES